MTARKAVQKISAAVEAPHEESGFSLISSEKLIELYTAMVKCSMIAEHAAGARKRGKRAAGLHPAGREASVAGVVVGLLPDDALSLSRSDFAAAFLKGMPLGQVLRNLAEADHGRGRKRSSAKRDNGAHGHVIPPAASAASQLNIVCGVAHAWKLMMDGKIAVAFCGEGAAPPEAWREALTFAGIHQLPILFVYHQNVGSEAEEKEAQARFDEIAALAQPLRIPALTVDGNDAVAVYRVACESIARARQGSSPTMIECRTYRVQNRTARKKPAQRRAPDPIRNMENYLLRKGLFNPGLKRKIAAAFRRELDAAGRSRKSGNR